MCTYRSLGEYGLGSGLSLEVWLRDVKVEPGLDWTVYERGVGL